MRILCVCNGGNCRSPVLAEVYKGHYGHDAIAVGTFWSSPETMEMLCNWAEVILPVEPFEAQLPPEDMKRWKSSKMWDPKYQSKLFIAPVGVDVWGHQDYEGLKAHCLSIALPLLKRIRSCGDE